MKSALKITAVLTLLAFTSTSLGWAEPVSNRAPAVTEFKLPPKIEIPKNLGTLQSFHFPENTDKPLILYIQDAHAVSDAQKNIRNLTAHFQSQYPVARVLLEGLGGEMDPLLLRAFPDQFILKKKMNDYFSRGEMTGAEMAAVLNPDESRYEGLEDWHLYEENTLAYLEASAHQPKLGSEIQSRQKELEAEIVLHDSLEQKELRTLVENFNGNTAGFSELIHYLARFREKARGYQRLSALLEAFARENTADAKIAELQIKKMAEVFRAKQLEHLSPGEQRNFQEQFQAFRTHQLDAAIFLRKLIDSGEPLGLKPNLTPELQACLKRNEVLAGLKDGKVFEELESFIRDLEDAAAQTPEAKRLLEETRNLRLLKKLAALELTRKQWEETVRKQGNLLRKDLWKPAVRFYELALKRDEVFHQKIRQASRQDKSKVLIIVAGGFHSQGFETFFKENQYPYAIITPAMNSLAGKENYEALMRGNVSWAPEVRTSLYDGFMRHAAAQLIAALNPLEQSMQIKFWRDEMLRLLGKQGRLAEAGSYTSYLDRYAGLSAEKKHDAALHNIVEKYKIRTLNSVWDTFKAQFEIFSAGFEELVQSKKINTENINALFRQAGNAAPAMLSLSLAKLDPSYKGGFLKFSPPKTISVSPAKKMTRNAFGEKTTWVPGSRFEAREINQLLLQSLRDEELQKLKDLVKNKIQQKDAEAKLTGQYLWAQAYRIFRVLFLYSSVFITFWVVFRGFMRPRIDLFLFGGAAIWASGIFIYIGLYYVPRLRQFISLKIQNAHLSNKVKLIENEAAARKINSEMLRGLENGELRVLMSSIETTMAAQEHLIRRLKISHQLNYLMLVVGVPLAPLVIIGAGVIPPLWGIVFVAGSVITWAKLWIRHLQQLGPTEISESNLTNLDISRQLIENEAAARGLSLEKPSFAPVQGEFVSQTGERAEILRRDETRQLEIHNGQLLRLGNLEDMRSMVGAFQEDEGLYLHDAFQIGKKAPDRIFFYDPMGQLLEKRTIDSIFAPHERFMELLAKPTGELKSPFKKEVGTLQELLQGIIRPFMQGMGLEDRTDEVYLSFEKELDSEGLPLFHLHFKLLGLGPQLTSEDFEMVPEEDREAFQQAFEFWYPYFYVHSDIDLASQDRTAAEDEKVGHKYAAQKPSLYKAALERVGEATHVIYQTVGVMDPGVIAGQVAAFFNWAETDLRDAFGDYSPDFLPISARLHELQLLQQYSLPVVQILSSKYMARHEARHPGKSSSRKKRGKQLVLGQGIVSVEPQTMPERPLPGELPELPRVTIYGGADDSGPGSSSFLLEIGNSKILLDGGKGSRGRFQKNRPDHLDAILLSHVHNDHSGDLPWISALFPETPIYTSQATALKALLMMQDSASFQPSEEKGKYKKNLRVLKDKFRYLDSKVWYQVTPEVKIRFQPASHVKGAHLIYIATPYRNYVYTGDFSGDAIRGAAPLELLEDFPTDELWEESTYGATVTVKDREEREQDFPRMWPA